jgi:hypothetical protein
MKESRMPINVDDVESLRSILSALPRHQPKQVSKQDAIASLVSELAAAQRRGYSTDDLARLMSEKGIDINGPTLRNCLRRLRKKRRPRDKATPRQASTPTTPASPSITPGDRKLAVPANSDAPKPPAPPVIWQPAPLKPEARLVSPAEERPLQK